MAGPRNWVATQLLYGTPESPHLVGPSARRRTGLCVFDDFRREALQKRQQAKNVGAWAFRIRIGRFTAARYLIRLYHLEQAILATGVRLLSFRLARSCSSSDVTVRVTGIQIVSPFQNRQRGRIVSQSMERGGEQGQRDRNTAGSDWPLFASAASASW